MRIKDFEALKLWLENRPDYSTPIPSDWRAKAANGEPLDTDPSAKVIMRRDQENVYTSFANADLLANKFAVRQKYSIDIPTHRHEYIEITYVAQGHVTVVIEGQEVQMRQGDLCIMDKNVRHSSGMMTGEDWVFNLIMTEEFFDTVFMYLLSEDNYISNYIVNSFYSEKKLRRHLLFHLEDEPFLEALLEQILCEYYAGDNWSEGKITSCLVILFTELSRMAEKGDSDETIARKLSGVSRDLMEYLKEHYQEANLSAAAEYLHFHPNYLCSVLKKETGKTFKELVTEVRMMEAANLLQNTDWKMQQIAQKIGYATEGYFYRQFRQKYHISPNKYREEHRKT